MEKIKIILIGGFLGSGKTTLMTQLAQRIQTQKNQKVALITNDQGDFLVDTEFARMNGFTTEEVLNGCFCCKFPDFLNAINSLKLKNSPDYIIAEPVGSCTDLLATVMNPLSAYHKDEFILSPMTVIVDGERLIGEYASMDLETPVTPKEILVAHQIKEAQILAISKTDLMSGEELSKAKVRLKNLNDTARIISYSALATPKGMLEVEALLDVILEHDFVVKAPMPIDYQTYAEAEAELGWYNGRFDIVCGEKDLSVHDFSQQLLLSLNRGSFRNQVAHGKLLMNSHEGVSLKSSLVVGTIRCDGHLARIKSKKVASATLNIRANLHPDEIVANVESILKNLSEVYDVTISNYKSHALIPSPPTPFYHLGA